MATSVPRSKRPVLISKLEGHGDTVNQAIAVPGEDAVISVSDDKSIRVWVKRDSGEYWPTICVQYEASASSLDYHHESQKVFIGLGNGSIHEYSLSRDLNRLEPRRNYPTHSSRVTAVKYVQSENWLLSVSRDKTFQWQCTKTARKLGSFDAHAWCLAIEYDSHSKYAFVADFSGQISVLKLDTEGFHFITTLKGHQSSIRCLWFDKGKRILFSGGFDEIVVVWDIGSHKGLAYELSGHKSKIVSLCYYSASDKLLSSSDDCTTAIWDLSKDRQETAEWGVGGACEKCGIPFFWNVKDMWTKKMIGVRQHHCRKCGRAVCHKCSENLSTYPPMGFEIAVRMCADCHAEVTTDDRTPMAAFVDLGAVLSTMKIDETRCLLVASCNKTIRLYDMTNALS